MVEYRDNFLTKEEYQKIYNLMTSDDISWYYTPNITFPKENANDNLFYMTHHFYNDDMPLSSYFDSHISPMFKVKLKARTFIRVKGNLYPSQNKLSQHKPHTDYAYEHKAAIYCINTCDGYTMFEDGKTISSVANRLITFDGSLQHASTDCTNTKSRININFNYL